MIIHSFKQLELEISDKNSLEKNNSDKIFKKKNKRNKNGKYDMCDEEIIKKLFDEMNKSRK